MCKESLEAITKFLEGNETSFKIPNIADDVEELMEVSATLKEEGKQCTIEFEGDTAVFKHIQE